MIQVATGQDNANVNAQLGDKANWYKNAYSQGGPYYDPVLLAEAGLASGATQPPVWSWLFRKDGKIVGGKWQWDPSTYPHLASLL